MLLAYVCLLLVGSALASPVDPGVIAENDHPELQQQHLQQHDLMHGSEGVPVQQPELKSSLEQNHQQHHQQDAQQQDAAKQLPADLEGRAVAPNGEPVALAEGQEGAPLGPGPEGDAPEKPEGDLDTANTFGWGWGGYYRPYYRSYYYSPYSYYRRSYYRPYGWGWGGRSYYSGGWYW